TLPPPTAPPAPDQQGVPPFPIHVFPEPLAGYARELQRSLNFPIDYTGAAFLFAASVAIGNSVHVKVKEGWTMAAILWVALVGRPGTSKTHPLDTALKHLKDRDTESYTRYKAELVQWEQEERDRTKRQEGHEAPKVRPVWRPHLVGDITMEALVGKLECSPRGLGVHRDELAGWWGSMDQYRKGSDRENWLTLHNGSTVDALRRTAGEVRVPLPFVSVCGTVQPAKLHTLGKGQDGFQPRILFAYPEKQTKPYFSDASIGSEWPLSYTTVLDRLLALPLNVENNRPAPRMLEFSETARVAFSAWVNLNTDRANAAPSDGIRDIYPKLETYAARIALVLELLDHAATGSAVSEVISGKAMKGAIDLVEYFATTALKVHFHLNEEDAVDRLPDLRKRVYEALPDQFRTGEGQEIADKFGMPQRTFKRFIGNENLFRKEAHGVVTKLR
ncbi:MAG: DUF3987 domain-containing protein, partial [Flavobacteriales bacterium]|nr:DUF3987 domain-containing protein [Flavobacteriales bacterium]